MMAPSLICSYYELAVVAHLESFDSDSSVSVEPPKHLNRSVRIPVIKNTSICYNVEISLNPFNVKYCFWKKNKYIKLLTHTMFPKIHK